MMQQGAMTTIGLQSVYVSEFVRFVCPSSIHLNIYLSIHLSTESKSMSKRSELIFKCFTLCRAAITRERTYYVPYVVRHYNATKCSKMQPKNYVGKIVCLGIVCYNHRYRNLNYECFSLSLSIYSCTMAHLYT